MTIISSIYLFQWRQTSPLRGTIDSNEFKVRLANSKVEATICYLKFIYDIHCNSYVSMDWALLGKPFEFSTVY